MIDVPCFVRQAASGIIELQCGHALITCIVYADWNSPFTEICTRDGSTDYGRMQKIESLFRSTTPGSWKLITGSLKTLCEPTWPGSCTCTSLEVFSGLLSPSLLQLFLQACQALNPSAAAARQECSPCQALCRFTQRCQGWALVSLGVAADANCMWHSRS